MSAVEIDWDKKAREHEEHTLALNEQLERALRDADEAFCHIKRVPDNWLPGDPGAFPHWCGHGASVPHSYRGAWRERNRCPACGKAICPDCIHAQQ